MQEYKTWDLRWTRFPNELVSTNWKMDHQSLLVSFSAASSGLIPISQIEALSPDKVWIPLSTLINQEEE